MHNSYLQYFRNLERIAELVRKNHPLMEEAEAVALAKESYHAYLISKGILEKAYRGSAGTECAGHDA